MLGLLASAVGSPTLAESRSRRMWLFLDEFPQLPPIKQFPTFLELGRSKGVTVVIGAQDTAQIRATYGPEPTQIVPLFQDTAEEQAAKQRAADEIVEQRNRDALAETERKRQAAIAAAEAAKNAKLEAQRQRDAADGYLATTIADIRVDYKGMAEGTRVIVSGFYSNLGQVAELSTGYAGASAIYVMFDDLPRDVRKRTLDCQACQVTIWAHTGCVMTMFSQKSGAPCFVADRLRMGGYGLIEGE
jgi:hypothetical protein